MTARVGRRPATSAETWRLRSAHGLTAEEAEQTAYRIAAGEPEGVAVQTVLRRRTTEEAE